MHRALSFAPDRPAVVNCLRDKRHVTKDLTLKHNCKPITLRVNDLARGLPDVYEMPGGRIQLHAKSVALPSSIFDPHLQGVTHAAISKDKHPSAAFTHIREEQEEAARPPQVRPESAQNG